MERKSVLPHFASLPSTQAHTPPPTPSFVGWVFVWYICGQVVSGKPEAYHRLLKQGPERTLPKGLALDFCSYDFYWTKPQLLIGLLVWCRQAPRWPFVSAECVIRIPPHIVLPLSFYISYSFWVPVCHFTNLSLGSWLKTEAQSLLMKHGANENCTQRVAESGLQWGTTTFAPFVNSYNDTLRWTLKL